jgi:hypothetical protein
MIRVPFEFWRHEGEDGEGFTAITKPVIPTPVGGMNLINRFIIPYASKPTFGPDWSVLFGVKFLIPTGEMKKSMQQ